MKHFLKRLPTLLIYLTFSVLLQGCSSDSSSSSTEPSISVESMANFVWINENIIIPKCLSCHNTNNPAAGLRMTTYDEVMMSVVAEYPEFSPFYDRTFTTTFFQLSTIEQEVIYLWIKNGALNNTSENF